MTTELVPQTTTDLVATGDVDSQVATAHRYPRIVQQRAQSIMDMATMTEGAAAECYYAIPRDGKTIEGPSVRLAEVVLSSWGNVRVASRIVRTDDRQVVAEGVCWDLESNAVMQTEVSRAIVTRSGKRYGDAMIQTTSMAAMSIAWRNALFKVIPRVVWGPVYDECRRMAAGDANSRRETVDKITAHFMRLKATPDMVLASVGVSSTDELTAEHVVTLRGYATAIKDGQATVEEVFASAPALEGEAKPERIKFGQGMG